MAPRDDTPPPSGNRQGARPARRTQCTTTTDLRAHRRRVWTHLALTALHDGDPARALRIVEHAVGGPWDAAASSLLDLAVVAVELGP